MSKGSRELSPIRPSEGGSVLVQHKSHPRPDGTTEIEIGIDLAEAPVPERTYRASVAGIAKDGDIVQLIFGQIKLGGKGLRSLIVISQTPEAIALFLKSCVEFGPSVRKYLANQNQKPAVLRDFDEEPDPTIELQANMIAAAQAGREVCLDFYHTTARALRDMEKRASPRLTIDPVVRINLSADLFAAVLDKLETYRPQLPQVQGIPNV